VFFDHEQAASESYLALISRMRRAIDHGHLEIEVDRCPADEPGYVRIHVEVEVSNFYPSIAAGVSMPAYMATQAFIHVLVTHAFLRSLATLELADPPHAAYIDEVEVGRRVAGHIRVAFAVADSATVAGELAGAGATVIAEPTRTPWASLNARLEAPADLQLTLFSDDDPA